ncbi:MAG TPA: transposase, partial [Bacteroidales bacterium]|nr:transposase [Bacteroidales bacterium]
MAQHTKHKSKEKRDDAKIIVLGLVVNIEGFIKFSSVFEGKKGDSESLVEIIDKIRISTSQTHRAVVVLDAGISTDENIELIRAKGYDYVCVSRAKIKDYSIYPNGKIQQIMSKANQIITLERVISNQTTDYLLKVHSTGKLKKEQSMKNQFEERFAIEINKVRAALKKKGGTKKTDKVQRRIGRVIQKYPSLAKHYDIDVITKGAVAIDILLHQKASYNYHQDHLGVYFIR